MKVLVIGATNIGYGGRSTAAYNLTSMIPGEICNFDFFCEGKGHIRESIESKIKNNKGLVIAEDYHGNNYFLRQFFWLRRLKHAISAGKYELFHIHADNALEAFREIIGIRFFSKSPIILHGHTSSFMKETTAIRRLLAILLRHLVYATSAVCIACSDEAWNFMYGTRSTSTTKKVIVKNGIVVERFRYDEDKRNTIRNQYGLSDAFVIGNVGKFYYPKNHARLLNIFLYIHKKMPEARLLLVGDGELKETIVSQASKLNILEWISFVGETENVEYYYQAMDVFVMPSFYEGYPLVGIEAQASGLPCVFSTGIPKVIAVTDQCEFLNLKCADEEWADTILNSPVGCDRYKAGDIVAGAGMDVIDAGNKVLDIYNKVVKDK